MAIARTNGITTAVQLDTFKMCKKVNAIIIAVNNYAFIFENAQIGPSYFFHNYHKYILQNDMYPLC